MRARAGPDGSVSLCSHGASGLRSGHVPDGPVPRPFAGAAAAAGADRTGPGEAGEDRRHWDRGRARLRRARPERATDPRLASGGGGGLRGRRPPGDRGLPAQHGQRGRRGGSLPWPEWGASGCRAGCRGGAGLRPTGARHRACGSWRRQGVGGASIDGGSAGGRLPHRPGPRGAAGLHRRRGDAPRRTRRCPRGPACVLSLRVQP